uniref:DUF5648 domain-containing protein n=1 Tax=Meloidogyne enterolobii TaxID=390850 RepID=A0A6V7V7E5_MELEN|nr:unnamed protein product [Meloidogyne enterolobii]
MPSNKFFIKLFNFFFILHLYSFSLTFAYATFSWPMARIPFEDDSRLTADNDMAVALNNARMDLQARTCVRLVPRKTEKDYVLFTDLGQNIECWNLFEPLPPKGQVLVNAGPSCLEPMKRPHKPKRVFSECDIEYVNHLYNCPKRRKPSPICPTGRLIMSKPDEYFERNLITTTTERQLSNEEIFSIGEGGGRGGNEEDYLPLNEKEEKGKKFNNKNVEEKEEEEEDSIRERPYISISIEAEETEELEYSTITTELPTTTIATTTIYPVTEIEEQTVTESNNIEEQIENSTELIEIQQTTSKTTENYLSTEEASTSLANLEEENNLLIISPDEEKLTTATPPQTTSSSSFSTSLDTSLSTFETNIPNPTNIVDIPSSNKFGESLGVMGRQPYPLMMTLIRTTTTTTILPPTPEWVRSVEESFLAGEQLGGSGEKKEIIGEKPHGDGWRILSTIGPPSPMPIPPILPPFQPLQPFQPVGEEEKEIISKIGGGSGGSNPLDPLPIKPGVIGIRNGTRINSQEEEEEEIDKSSNLIENNKGPKQKISAFLGVIQLPPGAAINIKERTKITKLVERTKYIGPCGSACTYGGRLVHLYRSFNNNPQILNHFYTTERLEQHLMGAQGFVMEPSMGYLGKNQIDPNCTCIRPLYRLYSEFAKDHFLTSNEDEKNIAETLLGYSFERILGYCTKEPGCGAYLPLYRFYNAINKDHFYTIDQQEMHYYKTHSELAFGFEKIECYVWQKSSSSRGCPALTLEIQEDEEERRRENEENKSIKNEKEENNKSFSDENIKLKRRRRKD